MLAPAFDRAAERLPDGREAVVVAGRKALQQRCHDVGCVVVRRVREDLFAARGEDRAVEVAREVRTQLDELVWQSPGCWVPNVAVASRLCRAVAWQADRHEQHALDGLRLGPRLFGLVAPDDDRSLGALGAAGPRELVALGLEPPATCHTW